MDVRAAVGQQGGGAEADDTGRYCEKCAVKDDATLLREGFAELRRAFPDMPEFKMQVIQEGSGVVH